MKSVKTRARKALDSMQTVLLDRDRFAQPIQLNFNSKSEIPTWCGFLLTLIVYVVLIIFAVQRAKKLVGRLRPEMSFELQTDVFGPADAVDLDGIGFKLAFGVMNYEYATPLVDDRYMQWNVFLETRKNLDVIHT